MDVTTEKDGTRGASPGRAGEARRLVWFAGCVALTAMIGAYWWRIPAADRFRAAVSPLDRVAGMNTETRVGWQFLWQARDVLPAGATYTIVGSEPHAETSLYFMSLAVLTELRGMPSHYGELPVEQGGAARYVLVSRCSLEPPGATLVQRLDDGCVWDRGAR
ncbi:MAG: hypothetical protein NDJ92_09465 [Thermoanaerobaculia bacterium]|nr:hypothetical protein [Thermoanaerobaculia bacterium]